MRKGNIPKNESERRNKRPLTPIELWEGRRAESYSALRDNIIPPFCEAVAFCNKEDRSAHTMPGFQVIYLSPTMTNMFTEKTHFVLRQSDWKLMKVRTVHANQTNFPLRALRARSTTLQPYVTAVGGVGDLE